MSIREKAMGCHREGFNCAQAVLCACAAELGLDREQALKLACAFGGGMARRRETCGAVTGALMAIGMKYGRTNSADAVAQDLTYAKSAEFIKRFEEANKSIVCKELLSQSRMSAPSKPAIPHCTRLVGCAGEILDQLL